MIKKTKFVSLLLFLCLFLNVFCVGNNMFEIKAEAKSQAVKYVTTNKEYKMNGRTILRVEFKRPVLVVKNKANKKINKYFKKLCAKHKNSALKYAKQFFGEYSSGLMVHSLTDEFTLTYNKNGIYSFKEYKGAFAGGAHDLTTIGGYSFSKKTGNKIPNSKLTKYSNKELKAKIYRKVERLYTKEPNRLFSGALETVKNKPIKDYTFYLKNNHLYAVFQCYEIAAWASGPQIFKIKL